MVFIPGSNTYHGFEKRPIKGVRTSLIINYVTNEWRAREQQRVADSTARLAARGDSGRRGGAPAQAGATPPCVPQVPTP